MSDQLTLFEKPLTAETLYDKLDSIVQEARTKYGYYKMHKSGMYELMKSAPESDLYDILELKRSKSGDISFLFDGQLFVKFSMKKEAVNATKELCEKFLEEYPFEALQSNAAPKGGMRVCVSFEKQIDFFQSALDYLVKITKPVNRFSCCSKYSECSKAGHCLHEHRYYSKGCQYRDNLDNGVVFY